MAKKKRTFWGFLLKFLLVITIIVVILFAILYFYIQFAFGVNIFDVYGQLKKLNEPVKISKIAKNRHTDEDFNNLIDKLQNSGLDYFYYEDGDGNIVIDPQETGLEHMTSKLEITDKEFASMVDNMIQNELATSINIADKDIELDLVQVRFSGLTEQFGNNQIMLSVIVRLNLKTLKEALNVFPLSIIGGLIPENLYIISNTVLQKTGDFSYTVTSSSLSANNLTASETANLFSTLNKMDMNIGDIQDLNIDIGEMFANALIGKSTDEGIAFKARAVGAVNFDFEIINEKIYFVINV